METETVTYTCPTCGVPVSFFPGFDMECKTRRNTPSHTFQPKPVAVDSGE